MGSRREPNADIGLRRATVPNVVGAEYLHPKNQLLRMWATRIDLDQ